MERRLVYFRPRTVLVVLAVALGAALVLRVLWVTRDVLIWAAIALFLAMALNPAVDWLQARGIRRRGLAVGIVFVGAVLGIVAIGALFVPTLVREVNDFAQAVPDYVDDLTKGRGRLGFLERDYQIVEKVREAIEKSGAAGVLGLSSTAVAVTKSVVSAVVAVLTIAFLTLFMLIEGPAWVERVYALLPEDSQPRWRRVGHEIYRTVGGYVTGNLAISFMAGMASTIVLLVLGVPYAVALGCSWRFSTWCRSRARRLPPSSSRPSGSSTRHGRDRAVVFFVVYQQFENHVLQPLVYGRTVQLSPLVVLIAVLVGAELAGVVARWRDPGRGRDPGRVAQPARPPGSAGSALVCAYAQRMWETQLPVRPGLRLRSGLGLLAGERRSSGPPETGGGSRTRHRA